MTDNLWMKSLERFPPLRLAIASILAYLSMAGTPAHAHGPTAEVIFLLLGALLVHVGAPISLLVMRRFTGRRRQVFGTYAAVMTIYYIVMWTWGVGEMFLFPVFPVFLVAILYLAVRVAEDHS